MYKKIIHFFYPSLNDNDIEKYWLLSLLFFIIIGTHWLLRLLKNTIFLKVAFPVCFGWEPQQGCLFQPLAKTWSPLLVLILLLVYSKLVDVVKKHQLFYIFSGFYAFLFSLFALTLAIREFYGPEVLGKTLLASLGWVSYLFIESFGSLFVALFWSYCNRITDTETAEQGFPLIVAMAQISASLGSSFLFFSGSVNSLWPLMLAASLLVLTIIPLVKYFIKKMAHDELVVHVSDKSSSENEAGFITGAFEGLYMLFSRPYLFGLLLVSVIYEGIAAMVDNQMNFYASSSPQFDSEIAFAKFQSLFGMSVNISSFIIALFITGTILSRFGAGLSLLCYPTLLGISLMSILLCFYTTTSLTVLLWTIFCFMVLNRAVGYALNAPATEMMYITTSKEANFKTKGWIDTFGSRFAKAGGASFTNLFRGNMPGLMLYGTFAGMGLIGVWVLAALYVGYTNMKLRKTNQVID